MNFIALQILLFLSFASVSVHKSNTKTYLKPHNAGGFECDLTNYVKTAHCKRSQALLVCKNGINRDSLQFTKYSIQHLRISEWPGYCFDINRLQINFPNLEELEIINSTQLNVFKGTFKNDSKIQKLTIHGLPYLLEVPPEVIGQMNELRILNLTNNGLRHIKQNLLRDPPHLEKSFLSNNKWDCSDGGLDWLAMENKNSTIRKRVTDYYQLLCHHQLYRGKPLHTVMDIIQTMRETCPLPCVCNMTHVVSDAAGTVIPLITVNCAKKHLEDPPDTLPPSTTTVRLEGNKISSIRHLIQNPQYKKLMDVYLDNNSIHSVKELEGSEWFSTFRVLSLRGNFLKQIPVYAFDKAFQSNNNIMHVFLGHNPWRCDCHFIPRFQGLLLKYKRVIRDLADIRCSKSDDKTISLVQISTLPLGNVCQKSEMKMPVSPINIVNITLLGLIILVLGRFLYDWHKFKTTGQLPWISSILP